LLAVTGAIAWLVPVVGAILAIVLPFVIGLLTSTQLSLVTVFYTLLVLITLQVWVEPRLFKLKWDNPVLTFVILLAMADAFGLVGIIIAPYISAIFHILWRMLMSERLASGTATRILDLREQHERLQSVIEREMQGPPPPLVISSMERLRELIDKAEPILDGAGVKQAETPDVFHTP
jgi:hypothetical protein